MTEPVTTINGRKICLCFIYPPIPDRSNDWMAYLEGDEEEGVRGWGETKFAAIDDLLANLDAD